jgi:antitoxin MazE
MRARIIRIGNSRGVRIPKPLLEEAGLTDEVEMKLEGDRLVIRPAVPARYGWDDEFAAAAEDDMLLDAASLPTTRWEAEEWQW